VFLVNSGSEAVDLALRLVMTATGRPTVLAVREAYHGWTIGSDAVSHIVSLRLPPAAAAEPAGNGHGTPEVVTETTAEVLA
jgi:4-aminobutyrate aminotransferase-like enzyme